MARAICHGRPILETAGNQTEQFRKIQKKVAGNVLHLINAVGIFRTF